MKRGARSGIGIGAALAYAAALLVFGLPVGVSIANHTVDVSTEAEYRDALTDLSAGDTAPHTINLTADITIAGAIDPTYTGTQQLNINGNGFTLDGGGNSRILFHSSSATLSVSNVTVTNGDSGASSGGGIFAGTGAPMLVTGSTFTGNTGLHGGGLFVTEQLTVTNSIFSGNTATGAGGGIQVFDGSATVTGSTISGNAANNSGGGIFTDESTTVTGSTISGNTTPGLGGGVAATGVTVTNSTVSGNTADGFGGGGLFSSASATLTHATVVDNAAGGPGAMNVMAANIGSTLTSFGSVVALPQGGGANCDIGGATTSAYSYSDDATCGFTGTGDTENGPDPNLGALASNGGPTQTRLPQTGSPLIDAIPVADCNETVTVDQRGIDRPQDGDENGTLACDIGAVEVEGTPPEDGDGDGDGEAGPADAVGGDPSFTG